MQPKLNDVAYAIRNTMKTVAIDPDRRFKFVPDCPGYEMSFDSFLVGGN